MLTFKYNAERCTACGLCAQHCTEDVLRADSDGRPISGDRQGCLECGHCVAVCAHGALTWADGPPPLQVARGGMDDATVERFLRGKRSCRHFRGRPVDRATLERLVNVAASAPSSKNCQERCFIVVKDPARLRALRQDLVNNTHRIRRLLNLMTSRPLRWLLPAETVAALGRMLGSIDHALAREDRGQDAIFYNAPAVVFIGGIARDPLGKDNALAAQHYLLLQAEAAGLGSCIMGYAQAAPKIIARHLDVPRFYRIYGVVALGHCRSRFHSVAVRTPPTVSWVEGQTAR